MNTFKVRIVRAAKGVYWYSDKVGKVFQVKASINKGFFTTVGVRMGLLIMVSDCVIVEDFRVGDRVMADESPATIISVGTIYDFIALHDDGQYWGYNKDELTLLEDTMEYTKDGKTYRQLRDITVKALVLAGADDEYVEYFGMDYNITEQIWLRIAIDFSSRWPERLQWLVDQGFVEVVEEIDINQILNSSGIDVRHSGVLAEKSVFLSSRYFWTLEVDDEGIQCLVPKRK